jgi:hypothetical protein
VRRQAGVVLGELHELGEGRRRRPQVGQGDQVPDDRVGVACGLVDEGQEAVDKAPLEAGVDLEGPQRPPEGGEERARGQGRGEALAELVEERVA